MTNTGAKVFLVDDDDAIRKSLSRALTKRGFEVESYGSASAFLSFYEPDQPGCLVLDYGMPEMNGLQLQAKLNEAGHAIPIIFITGHGGIAESVQAMKSGAIDFLEKPFRQDVLVERINAAFEIDASSRVESGALSQVRESFEGLTDREREIASLMMSRPSDASSKEIARQLDISPRTVDHHRARILEKMNVRSIAELVDLSSKAGLLNQ